MPISIEIIATMTIAVGSVQGIEKDTRKREDTNTSIANEVVTIATTRMTTRALVLATRDMDETMTMRNDIANATNLVEKVTSDESHLAGRKTKRDGKQVTVTKVTNQAMTMRLLAIVVVPIHLEESNKLGNQT